MRLSARVISPRSDTISRQNLQRNPQSRQARVRQAGSDFSFFSRLPLLKTSRPSPVSHNLPSLTQVRLLLIRYGCPFDPMPFVSHPPPL